MSRSRFFLLLAAVGVLGWLASLFLVIERNQSIPIDTGTSERDRGKTSHRRATLSFEQPLDTSANDLGQEYDSGENLNAWSYLETRRSSTYIREAAQELSAFDTPATTLNPQDIVDPEIALRLFIFYRSCIGAPRNQASLEQRMGDAAEYVTDDNIDSLTREAGFRQFDQMELAYERCHLIPTDTDIAEAAYSWLGRASDLGHPVARLQFYGQAMSLLLKRPSSLALRKPNLIEDFKARSESLAYAFLRHSYGDEGYYQIARMIQDSVVFDFDKNKYCSFVYLYSGGSFVDENDVNCDDIADIRSMARDIESLRQ